MRPTFVLVSSLSLAGLVGPRADAAVSVTVADYTPGTQVPATLNTAAYKDTTASKLQDFALDTGGSATQRFAVSLSNAPFAANTILPVGQGGSLTLRFQQPVNAVAGVKEFGIFVGNALASSGAFFSGDMRGAVLVSQDNVNWRTLGGQTVSTGDTATIYGLNAPDEAYQYKSGQQSWQYGTGSTRVSSAALLANTNGLADYTTEMPDDSIFNAPGAANAPRAALVASTDTTSAPGSYASYFGTSAGGNWFDISNSGLDSIQYVQVNVASGATASVRIDSVFANAVAVPEPAAIALLASGGLLALRRRARRTAGLASAAAIGAVVFSSASANAQSIDDVSIWAGSGANRAVLAVTWRVPEVFNNTTMPAPIATQTMLWGYRFNGTASGLDLFNAVVAADPKLYAAVNVSSFGTSVLGIGYDLDNDATFGLSDGTTTYNQTALNAAPVSIGYAAGDQFKPTDNGDLYWGGAFGPTWDLWNEQNGNGGFLTAPDRGPNPFFTPAGDFGGTHGQWDLAGVGLGDMTLENGSWVGFSVAAGGLEYGNDTAPGTVAYNTHKAAPATVPEPTMVALAGLAAVGLRRVRR